MTDLSDENTLKREVASISSPDVGATILHFRIERQIGAGAMGRVYLATDQHLRRRVALKFIASELMTDADTVRRFQREATSAAAISHPNVAMVHSIERYQDVPFIVYQYVPGVTLKQASATLPLQARIELLRLVASGLSAIHQAGVIHRDIKSSNIIVCEEDLKPVIVDFGLGKFVTVLPDDETQGAITRDHSAVGTLYYMSPEQVRGEEAGFPSDVFAFGIVAYEVLAGRRPFDRANGNATAAAILHEAPFELSTECKDLPAEIVEALSSCLEKAPERRPTAQYLRDQLSPRVSRSTMSGFDLQATKSGPQSSVAAVVGPADTWHEQQAATAMGELGSDNVVSLEFKFGIDRRGPVTTSVTELFRILKASQVVTDLSYVGRVIDDDSFRPQRSPDGIFAVIRFLTENRLWFWAARRSGDFYSLAVIPKDDRSRLAIERLLGEVMMNLFVFGRFSAQLGLAPSTHVTLTTILRRAKGLTLYGANRNRAFTNNLGLYGHVASTNEAVSRVEFDVADLSSRLREVIGVLFDDLVGYFNFASVPADYYDFALESFLQSHGGAQVQVRSATLDG